MGDADALRQVLDRLPVVVMHTDADGNCDLLRGGLMAQIGQRSDEGEGRNILTEWAHQPLRLALIRDALAGRRGEMLSHLGGRTLTTIVEPVTAADDVVGSLALVLDVTAAQEVVEARRRETELVRSQLHQLLRTQDQERRRIAHDIHDDTIQVIAAAAIRMQMLGRRLTGDPTAARELAKVVEALDAASTRVRSLVFDLDPEAPQDGVTAGELSGLATTLLDGTSVTHQVTGDLDPTPGELQSSALRRIAHEALVNVRKHADACHVRISLRSVDGGHELVVQDDGRGVGSGRRGPGHVGIRSMSDRAGAIGGRLEVDRMPEGGTRVRAWLPRRAPMTPTDATVGAPLVEMVESIQEGFLAVDQHWRVVWLNQRAADLAGASRQALLGELLEHSMPDDEDGTLQTAYERCMATQVPVSAEARHAATGRWLRTRAYPSPGGLTIFVDDVSDERAAAAVSAAAGQDVELIRCVTGALADAGTDGRSPCQVAAIALVEGTEAVEGVRIRLEGYDAGYAGDQVPDAAARGQRSAPPHVVDLSVTVRGRSVGDVHLVGAAPERLHRLASCVASALSIVAAVAPGRGVALTAAEEPTHSVAVSRTP